MIEQRHTRKRLYRFGILIALTTMLMIPGCSGGSSGGFDVFRGREATLADLENRSFTFSFVANGGPFDPSLQGTPTTLTIGAFDAMNTAPFTLQADGKTVSGDATFDPPRFSFSNALLTLTFLQVDPALPFTVNQELQLDVQADIDDGRVSLRNPVTDIETTSEPN